MSKKLSYALVAVALGLAGSSANASVVFTLNQVFSGDPLGGAFVTATFENNGANTVKLTIDATGLSSGMNAEQFYFNLDPTFSNQVSAAHISGVNATFSTNTSQNLYKADGDGNYDIHFQFTPGSELADNNTSVWNLSASGLDETDFNFFSAPSGGQGTFLAAAHIQNTGGPEDSSWVGAVPIPAAVWLFGSGLVGLLGIGRWKMSSAEPDGLAA